MRASAPWARRVRFEVLKGGGRGWMVWVWVWGGGGVVGMVGCGCVGGLLWV